MTLAEDCESPGRAARESDPASSASRESPAPGTASGRAAHLPEPWMAVYAAADPKPTWWVSLGGSSCLEAPEGFPPLSEADARLLAAAPDLLLALHHLWAAVNTDFEGDSLIRIEVLAALDQAEKGRA